MKQKASRSLLSLAVAATVGAAVTPQASAQAMLEEVIVTAQKREQSLQDVPVAVTAFTGEMLEKSGVKDMFDLQVNAPSLIVGQTQTSTTTTFSIRGVFTSSQNFGLEPSVGLYVDGVYRARQSSMINNLVDIAAVEVLRACEKLDRWRKLCDDKDRVGALRHLIEALQFPEEETLEITNWLLQAADQIEASSRTLPYWIDLILNQLSGEDGT